MNEPVSTIMTKELITLKSDNTLEDVRKVFSQKRIHHLPIVDDNYALVGLVTTFDLFKLGKSHEEYSSVKVSEIMTTKIATLSPEDKVGTACEVFLENLFHALPIVSDNKLAGLVTSFDVLKYTHKKEYPNHSIHQFD